MRSVWRLAGLALVLAIPAACLPAQEVAGLQRHLDSLGRLAGAAQARLEAYDDSVKRAVIATDTIRVGALQYVVEPTLAQLVRDAARDADDSLRAVLGTAYPRVAGHTIVVHASVPEWWERVTANRVVLSVVRPSGEVWRGWRTRQDLADVRETIITGALRSVFSAADPALFRWMGDVVPRDSVPDAEWIGQRVALVSLSAAVGPDCYQGRLEACKRILALVPTTDAVLQWHDAASRRRLVARNGATARRISNAMTLTCERGSDSACVALLQQFPPNLLAPSSSVSARLSLARLAVSLGGPGALARLLDTTGASATRLSVVAGMPQDSLVARWQARARDARVPSRDLSPEIAIVTAAWVMGLGALTLRSSRWR